MTRNKVFSASSLLTILVAACATPTNEVKPTAAQVELPHPDAIAGITWKVGDTCVTEYKYGYKRIVHTAVVTDVAGERVTLSDRADNGSVRVVVFEGPGGDHVVRRAAVSDGQQMEFTPPGKWLDFPLKTGSAWTSESMLKGETFQLNLVAKANAMSWETVSVPAGQFAAVKIVSAETYTAGRNFKGESFSGSGTLA